MAMAISWAFPRAARDLGQPGAGLPCGFLAAIMVVQVFVVALVFPEPKRVLLEDMGRKIG